MCTYGIRVRMRAAVGCLAAVAAPVARDGVPMAGDPGELRRLFPAGV
jgi:hypothetical protein